MEIIDRIRIDSATISLERMEGAGRIIRLCRHYRPPQEAVILSLDDLAALLDLAERNGWKRAVPPPPPPAAPPPPPPPAAPEGRDVRQWRPIGHDDPRKAVFGAGAREGRDK